MKKFKLILIFVLSLIFIYAMIYGHYVEPYNVKTKKIDIFSHKISRNSPGIKIVHISDVHMKRLSDYEIKVAEKINRLEPDVILLTGDFFSSVKVLEPGLVDSMHRDIEHIVRFINLLRAKHGIFVSRGNYDFSDDKEISDLFIEVLDFNGTTALTNCGTRLEINGDPLYLFGVDFPGFPQSEVTDFRVADIEANNVLQALFSEKNSYSHFAGIKNIGLWKDYIYSGRMRLTETEKSGIGITFYSQFYRGLDKYYRLRQAGKDGTFQLSPHGTAVTVENINTGFSPEPNTWVRFKIECISLDEYTEMRARVWTDGSPEPDEWTARAVDSSSTRLKNGTVGLWSGGEGGHQFDDLIVVNVYGDTLLSEDFEEIRAESNPENWVDYNYGNEAIPVLMRDVDPSLFTVLLSHTPDYVLTAQKYKIDLVLSGHTHGGQVCLPVIGPLVSNIKLGRKYMQGLHKFNNTSLYVTRGIGTVLLPLRFFCPPEITVINLLPE
ncbi:metallophosphoesterase [candidate division KSB1 bacterium]|nr:metallophosphoesterase [candidate division KSB1 bacterium]